jgi:hypothetical protein
MFFLFLPKKDNNGNLGWGTVGVAGILGEINYSHMNALKYFG